MSAGLGADRGETAFFERSANGYTPTSLPISPWNPNAINGIAIGPLLVHIIEEQAPPTELPMGYARFTLDLLGAAPRMELVPRFTVLRAGGRMQLLQSELVADGRVVARGQALRVRQADTPRFESPVDAPLPEELTPTGIVGDNDILASSDRRYYADHHRVSGPGGIWVNLSHELIRGEPLTPLVRTATVADFGAGVGDTAAIEPISHPNVDITIYMTREPVGEWLLMESFNESAGNGYGFSTGRIADRTGTVARIHQTMFIERGSPLRS